MPKHSTDLFVRGQVLAAYAAFEDRPLDLTHAEGTVVKQTKILLDNMRRVEEQAQREQLKLYFAMWEAWYDEVELIVPVDEQRGAMQALQKLVPKMDARIADRVYQLFKNNPESLNRLHGVNKTHFFGMSASAFAELKQELNEQGEAMRLLDELVDV